MLSRYLGLSRGTNFSPEEICPKMGKMPIGEPDL
jgi:hypothetical protein